MLLLSLSEREFLKVKVKVTGAQGKPSKDGECESVNDHCSELTLNREWMLSLSEWECLKVKVIIKSHSSRPRHEIQGPQ